MVRKAYKTSHLIVLGDKYYGFESLAVMNNPYKTPDSREG